MTNSPLRLAMVGGGAFSRRYHLPAIEADKGVALATIFDPTPVEAVRDLAERHGAPLTSDLAAALAPGVADAAIVTTPHALHAAHIDAVLAAGLHVLVDKPFVVHGWRKPPRRRPRWPPSPSIADSMPAACGRAPSLPAAPSGTSRMSRPCSSAGSGQAGFLTRP